MKKQYNAPTLEKVKATTVAIACKSAQCSGSSTHKAALK